MEEPASKSAAGARARDMSSLPEVLPHLDLFALDVLTQYLDSSNSLASARLCCRALRSAVDGSLKHITLTISPANWAQLQQAPSPLGLLPRCTSLNVVLTASDDAPDEADGNGKPNSWMLQVPGWLFGSLPADRLQLISQLKVSTKGQFHKPQTPVLQALPLFMTALPGLQTLDIYGVEYYIWEAAGREACHALLSTLAGSCPKLESLAMPGGVPLAGLEGLARSLTRLEIQGGAFEVEEEDEYLPQFFMETTTMDLAGLPALAHQLPLLRTLRLANVDAEYNPDTNLMLGDEGAEGDEEPLYLGSERLLKALHALPPWLERLELHHVGLGDGFSVDLAISLEPDGRVSRIDASRDVHLPDSDLGQTAELLLSWRALGQPPQIPQLHFPWLRIYSRDELLGPGQADDGEGGGGGDEAQGPARQLLQACKHVSVGWLQVGRGAGAEGAREALQALGLPERLTLGILAPVLDLRRSEKAAAAGAAVEHVYLPAGAMVPAPVDAEAWPVAAAPALGFDLDGATPEQVLAAVAARLEAGEVPASELKAPAEANGAAAPAGRDGEPEPGGGDGEEDGPQLAGGAEQEHTVVLLRGPLPEDAVGAEDRSGLLLWLRGLAAAGPDVGNGDSGDAVASYLDLPASGAVMVRCTSGAATARLAAAVAPAAGSPPAAAGGSSLIAMVLPTDSIQRAVEGGLRQVLAELWRGSEGCGLTDMARLQQVAGLWAGVVGRLGGELGAGN